MEGRQKDGEGLVRRAAQSLEAMSQQTPRQSPRDRVKGEQRFQYAGCRLLQTYTSAPTENAMRILLAEDDPIIADGLCRALKKAGYAVDHVPNGADADAVPVCALAGMADPAAGCGRTVSTPEDRRCGQPRPEMLQCRAILKLSVKKSQRN